MMKWKMSSRSARLIDLDLGWRVDKGTLYARRIVNEQMISRNSGHERGVVTYGDELQYFVDEYNRGTEIQYGLPFGPVEWRYCEKGLFEHKQIQLVTEIYYKIQ